MMTARGLRLALLAVVLAVGASVALTYRPRSRGPAAAAATPSPAALARTQDLVFRSFRKEEQSFSLTARESVGREQEELRLLGVALAFGYTVYGAPQQGTITADECQYQPAQQRAFFRGRVRVTSAEGFELFTEALFYHGDKNLVRADGEVQFRRKDVTGSAKGVTYEAQGGRLELSSRVVLHMRDPDNPPMDITAGRALLQREGHNLLFDGGVSLTQGADTLRSRKMLVEFGEGDIVHHIQALEEVDLRTSGAAPSRLAQHLACRKLDLVFRADRSLAEAVAGQAELTLPPATGQAEGRTLAGRILAFSFDEQGRMISARGQQGTTFTVDPGGGGPPRVLRSQRFMVQLDPASGEMTAATFEKDVSFEQGARRGSSQQASYDGKGGFSLQLRPELVDEEHGIRLKAEGIDVATRTGDLEARRNVRCVLLGKRKSSGLLGASGEPTVVTAPAFAYTAATREARYSGGALLRSGRDEVRAAELALREQDGQRRLEAKGSVSSRLVPPAGKGGAAAEAVEGRSEEMTYDESRREAVYRTAVVLRQGEVVMRSPQARLSFAADGGRVERLEAGEPVQIEQGARRASGARGTYTPQDRRLVVEGDKVVLRDAGQVVQGRKVTFHVGDDRILVDGGEQVRTQTVFRREPKKP